MPRSYRHIKDYEKEILELKENGLTHREIAEKYGLTKEYIKQFFNRYNRNQRKLASGIKIKPKGRPKKGENALPPPIQQLSKLTQLQYEITSKDNLTKSYGITPSMSRRGNPYDNALAENFFSILKTECIYRVKLKTYEEARLLISQYIDFYNNQRIQLKTKLTPLELRSQFVA